MSMQNSARVEGKLRPCLPTLTVPPVEDKHREEWTFFDKKLTEYKDYKSSGMCFKCTGNWWANWELTCGRSQGDSSKHPTSLPARVGSLEFPWNPSSAATGCGYTSCVSMDNMDRAASRAFREESAMFGWKSARKMPEGSIWVCGESTWTVKASPTKDTPAVYETILKSESKDLACALCDLKCGYGDKATVPAKITAATPGSHYGGVLCVVLGTSTTCRQFQTGAGVLGDGVKESTLDKRCSAWEGAYFDTKALNEEHWEFLANQEYQQNRVESEPGSSAYPMCAADSGPMGADAGGEKSKCSLFAEDTCTTK